MIVFGCVSEVIRLIYDKIKEICKVKGISVAYLERQAGLSNGSVSKWNNSRPTIDKLCLVAKVLDITLEELIS